MAGDWRRDQMQKDTNPDREGFQAGCSHSGTLRIEGIPLPVSSGPGAEFPVDINHYTEFKLADSEGYRKKLGVLRPVNHGYNFYIRAASGQREKSTSESETAKTLLHEADW